MADQADQESGAVSDFSSILFTDEQYQPMVYCIRPSATRARLKLLIESGGGRVTSRPDPSESNVIKILADGDEHSSPDCLLPSYIDDCVAANSLLDKFSYRVKSSSREEQSTSVSEVTVAVSTKGRSYYTAAEDEAILEYIAKHPYQYCGNKTWQRMEIMKITTHSWQSMRDHFLKKLEGSLNKYTKKHEENLLMKEQKDPDSEEDMSNSSDEDVEREITINSDVDVERETTLNSDVAPTEENTEDQPSDTSSYDMDLFQAASEDLKNKKADDRRARGIEDGKTSSPRRTTSSPRRTTSSPRLTAPSPRRTAPSPRRTTLSPRRTAPSPRRTAPSPRRTTLSPRRTAPSPRRTAPSPRRTAPSPRRTALSPRRTTSSPRRTTPSSRRTAPSPRRTAPSPRRTAPSPRRTTSSPRRTTPSSRRTAPSPSRTATSPRPTALSPKRTAPSPRSTAPSPRRTAPSPRRTAPSPRRTTSSPRRTTAASTPDENQSRQTDRPVVHDRIVRRSTRQTKKEKDDAATTSKYSYKTRSKNDGTHVRDEKVVAGRKQGNKSKAENQWDSCQKEEQDVVRRTRGQKKLENQNKKAREEGDVKEHNNVEMDSVSVQNGGTDNGGKQTDREQSGAMQIDEIDDGTMQMEGKGTEENSTHGNKKSRRLSEGDFSTPEKIVVVRLSSSKKRKTPVKLKFSTDSTELLKEPRQLPIVDSSSNRRTSSRRLRRGIEIVSDSSASDETTSDVLPMKRTRYTSTPQRNTSTEFDHADQPSDTQAEGTELDHSDQPSDTQAEGTELNHSDQPSDTQAEGTELDHSDQPSDTQAEEETSLEETEDYIDLIEELCTKYRQTKSKICAALYVNSGDVTKAEEYLQCGSQTNGPMWSSSQDKLLWSSSCRQDISMKYSEAEVGQRLKWLQS